MTDQPDEELPAWELDGLRPNGEVYTVEVLGYQPVEGARKLAQLYADLWHATVNLNRVPFVHTGSEAWETDQKELIEQFVPATRI